MTAIDRRFGPKPEQHEIDFVTKAIDRLIAPANCALSNDKTLFEQLPGILAKQYGVESRSDVDNNTQAYVIFRFTDRYAGKEFDFEALPSVLSALGIDGNRWNTVPVETRDNVPATKKRSWLARVFNPSFWGRKGPQ